MSEEARVQDLRDRFEVIFNKDSGMPGYHVLYNADNINPRAWLEDLVLDSDHAAAEAAMAALEAEEANQDATRLAVAGKDAVMSAMDFGRDVMAEYGSRNIAAGYNVTQIKQILTDLADLQAAMLSGSLYVAKDIIDNFTATAEIPQSEIDYFKAKVDSYLGV